MYVRLGSPVILLPTGKHVSFWLSVCFKNRTAQRKSKNIEAPRTAGLRRSKICVQNHLKFHWAEASAQVWISNLWWFSTWTQRGMFCSTSKLQEFRPEQKNTKWAFSLFVRHNPLDSITWCPSYCKTRLKLELWLFTLPAIVSLIYKSCRRGAKSSYDFQLHCKHFLFSTIINLLNISRKIYFLAHSWFWRIIFAQKFAHCAADNGNIMHWEFWFRLNRM